MKYVLPLLLYIILLNLNIKCYHNHQNLPINYILNITTVFKWWHLIFLKFFTFRFNPLMLPHNYNPFVWTSWNYMSTPQTFETLNIKVMIRWDLDFIFYFNGRIFLSSLKCFSFIAYSIRPWFGNPLSLIIWPINWKRTRTTFLTCTTTLSL